MRSLGPFQISESLKDRLVTAFFMIVAAIVLSVAAVQVPYGGFLSVAVACAVVAMAVFEVVRLFARDFDTLHYRPLAGTVMYGVLILPSLAAAWSAVQSVLAGGVWWRAMYVATLVSVVGLIVALSLEGRQRLEQATQFAERYGIAFLVVGLSAPALILIAGLPQGLGVYALWWIAGCAALNDVAAYFVGRAWGNHRMAPALSPNKSLEGCVAGLVVGTVAGVLLWNVCIGQEQSVAQRAVISFIVVVVAQAVDLAKSYLKRIRGVKDMGALFPGHGGVLDRFDAMIGAAPVVLTAMSLLGIV